MVVGVESSPARLRHTTSVVLEDAHKVSSTLLQALGVAWKCTTKAKHVFGTCAGFQPPLVDGGILESEQDKSEDGRGTQELSRVVRGGTPGDFNLYIFAMSWKAEW